MGSFYSSLFSGDMSEVVDEKVTNVHSVEKWNELLLSATYSGKLVVIFFTATWCGPCRLFRPVFAEIAKEMTDVIFLKVDVDEMGSIAKDWDVTAMPTFVFYKDGKRVDKVVGAKKEELLATIKKRA